MTTIRIMSGTDGVNWTDVPTEPTINDDVTITKGKLIVNSGYRYTDDCTVKSGTTLQIDAGATLSVWILYDESGSTVTINGTLIQRGIGGVIPGIDVINWVDTNEWLDTTHWIDINEKLY